MFLCLQVYYPVRHHLVQHMISAMQRLGFTPSVTIEQRKLAVDLAEVVIKWELQRFKDQQVCWQEIRWQNQFFDFMQLKSIVHSQQLIVYEFFTFLSLNQKLIQEVWARVRVEPLVL